MGPLRAAAGGGVRAEDKRLNSAPKRDRRIEKDYECKGEGNTSLYTAAKLLRTLDVGRSYFKRSKFGARSRYSLLYCSCIR